MTRTEPSAPTVLEYLSVLWRYRWLVAVLGLVAAATAAVISTRTPKVYESTTTLITPREGNPGTALSGLAASAVLQQVPGLSIPSLTPTRDMLLGILRSRTVAQAVAERFGLHARYKTPYPEDAIERLQRGTMIAASKEGIISITVEDTDPQLATAMANFYVQELDKLASRYGVSEAGRQRRFIDEHLGKAKAELVVMEEGLRRFQERNQAFVLQDQTRGAIEAAARLKGEMLAGEVQLQVMRSFATDANPEVVAVKRRVDEMRRQLAEIQYGDDPLPAASPPGGTNRSPRDLHVPFARVPGVGIELARLTREVKVRETLVTMLTQQLEQARIVEAKDVAVQVLDVAVPPRRHSRPRRAMNIVVAGGAGLLLGTFVAFFTEYVRRERRRAIA